METKHLLIVDDSKMVRKIIAISLKDEKQFTLHEAGSGLEALDKLMEIEAPVDLIFTDINMPNMDGLELIRRCQEDEKYQGIPIIVITTEDGAKDRQRALELGAVGFVSKPLDRASIVDITLSTLKKYARRDS
ncbi:two-component system response regulator [candidate division KSB3 bacterium]|uniref:Two-component system response regulator n=1 Tax=candidate division KSB3 bacterium TaxID=2044937 RepID=A0A2G6E8E1_9BACT|nr:MAG: two-component system response regulator [candidate division KSB3 bacterium]PIE30654.1 MAG: two-component system response regulator [candidate division KSB3 bacterium]